MLQWHVLVSAAAMELVAMELKQSGSFIARTLSYEVFPIKTQSMMLARVAAMLQDLVQHSECLALQAALHLPCTEGRCSFGLAVLCLTEQLQDVDAPVNLPT